MKQLRFLSVVGIIVFAILALFPASIFGDGPFGPSALFSQRPYITFHTMHITPHEWNFDATAYYPDAQPGMTKISVAWFWWSAHHHGWLQYHGTGINNSILSGNDMRGFIDYFYCIVYYYYTNGQVAAALQSNTYLQGDVEQ